MHRRRAANLTEASRARQTAAGLIDGAPGIVVAIVAMARRSRARRDSPEAAASRLDPLGSKWPLTRDISRAASFGIGVLRERGSSPGQMLLGLTVLDAKTGTPLSWHEAVRRAVAKSTPQLMPAIASIPQRRQRKRAAAARRMMAAFAKEHRDDPGRMREAMQDARVHGCPSPSSRRRCWPER
jgi:uncharacterized RDD family membrane protein YckC